ncbi:uncharacterized protein LOC135829472 isoform X2 [Sycon ciliatum]|uniref:uncharacterized protein LOC135829472 isoform X2 n=1 Tax=Sycon ciliatum TaxID=27933 RepID=UPI0031F716EF
MAEGQPSVMAQPGAGTAGTAEKRLKVKGKHDERVIVTEPSAETPSPFHSIFALKCGCVRCDKKTQVGIREDCLGTCFLLSDLNSASKDYIIFATAAHNLVCCDCGEWCWVQIYTDLSEEKFLTNGKISRKNENGCLIVPDWYKENATKKHEHRHLHDYGIIAVKTSKVCPLVKWADKKLLGVATQCKKKEDDVRMCGYPLHTYYDGKKIKKPAEKCKYWVDEPRRAEFGHDQLLHHFVDSSPGQSGSPVFLLPKEDEAETTCATGYVVGIHVKGGHEHNSAVMLRDERERDTKPMVDLREWANNPPAFLPEESVAVVCSEKSVKPGVRPSEQIGLHGDGPQPVIGPEEPKKMFYDDPFDHPDYVAKIDVPLKDLDGVELRQRLQKKGLLTKSQVKRLEKMSSETHNNELIGWIQSSRRHGYVALCEVIQELKVVDPELLKDMKNLL